MAFPRLCPHTLSHYAATTWRHNVRGISQLKLAFVIMRNHTTQAIYMWQGKASPNAQDTHTHTPSNQSSKNKQPRKLQSEMVSRGRRTGRRWHSKIITAKYCATGATTDFYRTPVLCVSVFVRLGERRLLSSNITRAHSSSFVLNKLWGYSILPSRLPSLLTFNLFSKGQSIPKRAVWHFGVQVKWEADV